jgi:hypothetical protein
MVFRFPRSLFRRRLAGSTLLLTGMAFNALAMVLKLDDNASTSRALVYRQFDD